MQITLLLVLLVLLCTHLSLQAPPHDKARQARWQKARDKATAMFSQDDDLLSIVRNRPKYADSVVGKEFKRAFARHPDVNKFKTLAGEAYIDHALELRKIVEEEDPAVKVKFRKAILHHMEEEKVDQDLQNNVKAHLSQAMKKARDRKSFERIKARNPIAYKEKKKKWNDIRVMKAREQRANKGSISPFEKEMKALNLPDNASASQIEVIARNIVIHNGQHTTGQLRKYLKERFSPADVRNAMTNRSFHFTQKNNANYEKGRQLRRQRSQEQQQFSDVGESGVGASVRGGQASSSHAAVEGHTSRPLSPAKSPHGAAHPASQFDTSDWWDKVYHSDPQ